MPAKYSHVKKRSTQTGVQAPVKKSRTSTNGSKDSRRHRVLNAHIDRTISDAMSAVSQLERAIARILLIRYEQDIARLFSTHLFSVALIHLPTFMMQCISIGGPGWVAHNYDCDEIKDFLRSVISMDMRQAGERVATKSVLWSYTALRDFALANNVSICQKRGLHSLHLLPFYPALKSHLDALEAMPPPSFTKPPHLGPLTEGLEALEEACELKYGDKLLSRLTGQPEWDEHWRLKIRTGYEWLSQTLWRVAREFDVRGYGSVLREKLTSKWCDCGCSTDHLGEVCERTVREEEGGGTRSGKRREWDGRGSGIFGWETEEEEDIWEVDLAFGGSEHDECDDCEEGNMTIEELMEWRYYQAEKEKEQGNVAFRRGDFDMAIKHYNVAHEIEPELPHYQLNLAAAYLKLNKWIEAEKACTKALSQHRSVKGYFRRAKANKMLGRTEDALRDLRVALKVQPTNTEAMAELLSYKLAESPPSATSHATSSSSKSWTSVNHDLFQIPKPKPPKQPPFARTSSDDKKIKVVTVPMTVEVPIPVLDQESSSKSSSHMKAGKAKKNKDVKLKAESILCPGWERYIIRKG